MKEKLKLVESRSEVLEEKLKALKKMQSNRSATKSPSMARKVIIINENKIKEKQKIRHV